MGRILRMGQIPSQNQSKAITFKVAGWIAFIGGFLLVLWLDLNELVLAVPFFVGYLLLRQGKKHTVQTGEAVLKTDSRPPVLYLRSFDDETEERSIAKYFKNAFESNRKSLAHTVPPVGIREQDSLGFVFRKIGPYIALGKPGEELSELGSSKIYVPNESWQDTIHDFLQKSKCIIFKAGKTEGLKWELKEIVQRVNPLQIVMIMPIKDDDYSSFIQWANAIMPKAFPKDYPSGRMIVFDKNWDPSCLPLGRTLTKSLAPFFQQNGISVKETYWEKILEHNGVRW